MRQQRQLRVVCQVLAVVLALAQGSLCDATSDTQGRGDGSYAVIGTGVAVHPEKTQHAPSTQIKSKAQYTRTALHVARSLDPDAEETVTVRTRTGDVASLIVKRRNRSQIGKDGIAPPPYPLRHAAASKGAAGRMAKGFPANIRVPDPVNIKSTTVLVKPAADAPKKSRSLMKIDSEGIPVIEGVRVPDDADDKIHTWRNARVINGVLVPNNVTVINNTVAAPPVPARVPARASAVALPPARSAVVIPSGGVSDPISASGSAPAPGSASGPVLPASGPASGAVLPPSLGAAAVQRLAESAAQSPWIPTSPDGANVVAPPLLTPEIHGLQSRAEQQRRILEYIRAVNQLEAGRAVSAANAANARGRMLRNTNTEGNAVNAEARVLLYQPSVLYSSGSSSSTNPTRVTRVVSFEEGLQGLQGVRTPVLQYAHPELGVQPAKVAPPAPPARNQDRALAYFGQDVHADRSPFAREPGLDQPEALTEEPDHSAVKLTSAKRSSSETASTLSLPQRPKKVQPIEDSYGLASDKYIKRFPHAASYKDYRDYKDDYGSRYNGYGGYAGHGSYNPHYGGYAAVHSPFVEDSRPFWVRLSDQIQTSMRTGMERMSDLARPVVDPLMEASAKISHNLGFTSTGHMGLVQGQGQSLGPHAQHAQHAQDRLGSVGAAVAAPSMLLPALGLVASGAALGLGAVAVGRYLDVDVMAKRSEASDEDALEMEHKRALNALRAGQQRFLGHHAQHAQQDGSVDGRQVTDTDVVAQVVNVVNKEQQQQHHHHNQQEDQHHKIHSRARRDNSANSLDSAELAEERRQLALRAAQLGAPTAVWGSTPCAQRVFCDVLAREGADSALLMEKKMATLLAMLPRVAPEAAAVHLSAVMAAVRQGDCSVFVCPLSKMDDPR